MSCPGNHSPTAITWREWLGELPPPNDQYGRMVTATHEILGSSTEWDEEERHRWLRWPPVHAVLSATLYPPLPSPAIPWQQQDEAALAAADQIETVLPVVVRQLLRLTMAQATGDDYRDLVETTQRALRQWCEERYGVWQIPVVSQMAQTLAEELLGRACTA